MKTPPPAPDPSAQSDTAIAQAFRLVKRKFCDDCADDFVLAVERHAAEIDAAPAAAGGVEPAGGFVVDGVPTERIMQKCDPSVADYIGDKRGSFTVGFQEGVKAVCAASPTAQPSAKDGAGDWPEDFSHENGNYNNTCHQCQRVFVGHKRRVTCKLCSAKDGVRGDDSFEWAYARGIEHSAVLIESRHRFRVANPTSEKHDEKNDATAIRNLLTSDQNAIARDEAANPKTIAGSVSDADVQVALDAKPFTEENYGTRVWQTFLPEYQEHLCKQIMRAALQSVWPGQQGVSDDTGVLAVLDAEIERQRIAVAAGRHDADAMAEFEAARATIALSFRDAGRYRFLRDSGLEISWNAQVSFSPGYAGDAHLMEIAIDNAIAATQPPAGKEVAGIGREVGK